MLPLPAEKTILRLGMDQPVSGFKHVLTWYQKACLFLNFTDDFSDHQVKYQGILFTSNIKTGPSPCVRG